MKTTLFALVILLVSAPIWGQFGILKPTDPPELNDIIEATVEDSSESNFILGASSLRIPTPLVPFPAAPGTLTIISSSASDTTAGIGAQEVWIEVIYEDPPGVFSVRSAVISMDGLSVSPASGDIAGTGVRRIRRMRVFAVGNQEIHQPIGRIVASVDGVPTSEILSGQGRSEVAVWTTAPHEPEEIDTIEIRFVTAAPGMTWEINSAIYTREFSIGHGWVSFAILKAREPQDEAQPILNKPFTLPPLTDVMYEIGTTVGADRHITAFIQISNVE